MGFWNSIDKLTFFNNLVQGFAIMLGILAAVLGLLSFILSIRKSSLEKKAESAKEQQIKKLDTVTKELSDKTSYLDTSTKELHDKTKNLDTITKDLSKRTTDIRELEQRRLSAFQIEELTKIITKITPVPILFVRNNSNESQGYSIQFENIFKKNNWIMDNYLPATNLRQVSPFTIGYTSDELKNDVEKIARIIQKTTQIEVRTGGVEGNLGKFKIVFDVGVIPANEYQTIIDKMQ